MNNFDYSDMALSVKASFYGKEAMVYVEGEDDVTFWRYYFDAKKFEIQSKGGKEELKKYIMKIQNGISCFIVACDSDYSNYIKEFEHPLIVKTIGYSIENTMYCPLNINELISIRARINAENNFVAEIEDILKNFFEKLKPLFVYDIINSKKKKGIDILSRTCNRFLKSNDSVEVDTDKVLKHIIDMKDNTDEITDEEISEVLKLISDDKRKFWLIPRGHFLTNEVINIVNSVIKRTTDSYRNINIETLYAETFKCAEKCRKGCTERKLLKKRISSAINALKKH